MPDDNWGHCQHCKHFASPARAPLSTEEATCSRPELAKHGLTAEQNLDYGFFVRDPEGVPVQIVGT